MILLFIILMLLVFGKLLFLAFRATWGIAKILLTFILLPAVIVVMALGGLIAFAIPILIIIGIITVLCSICGK